jgi:hypothetical protein
MAVPGGIVFTKRIHFMTSSGRIGHLPSDCPVASAIAKTLGVRPKPACAGVSCGALLLLQSSIYVC